ncbi:MAG: hypothetical protein K2N82_00380, partial [Lachnospiraceae bacterium]|nr:hypothetical protein [Lachnospiraceae bacterium]
YSYAVSIDEKGVGHVYVTGDLKPEVRAKIEAKIKAEDEEKAKRKRRYQELSQEAAQKRKQEMKIAYKKRSMTELIANQAAETSRITYAETPETMSSVIAAYGMSALTMPGILK